MRCLCCILSPPPPPPFLQIADLPADVITMLMFLEEMCSLSKLSRKVAEVYIPSYLFDEFKHHAS